jgi:hypothetical protein
VNLIASVPLLPLRLFDPLKRRSSYLSFMSPLLDPLNVTGINSPFMIGLLDLLTSGLVQFFPQAFLCFFDYRGLNLLSHYRGALLSDEPDTCCNGKTGQYYD